MAPPTMKEFLGRLSGKLSGADASSRLQAAVVSASTPAEYVESALAHHRAGRLAEAESLYLMALAVDPGYVDALHLLGVVRQQSGDSAKAVEMIGRAVALAPENSSAHNNVGLAYQSLNRVDDAETCFVRSLQLNPYGRGAGRCRTTQGAAFPFPRLRRY
jgi:tetratricopeptide (TPR) repeat protein